MALDLSGPKTPPPAKRPTPAQRQATAKTGEREEGLNGLFQIAAAGCLMGGQVADGAAVSTHGPNIAREAAQLAETNERMGRLLDYLTAVGPFAGLLAAAMPLGLQILVNHGKLPVVPALQQFGIVPPGALEAQAKADAARQMAEYQRAQAAAEEELRELQRDEARRQHEARNGSGPSHVPASI